MSFQFATPGRIVFGWGEAANLEGYLRDILGRDLASKRALVVTGSSEKRAAPLLSLLEALGVAIEIVLTRGEPTLADAESAMARGRELRADFVVGCGGGSALDLAKVAALLIPNRGKVLDYLEVIGMGKTPETPALPVIALPTTSGTGSEVTKNGVLCAVDQRVKVSLRHDSMLPRLALIDPELTLTVPPDITAATGLDALTQCIEPYLSCMAQPLTDGIARQGILAGARSLGAVVREGTDRSAREDMSLCSLFGGLSLANAKLGAVHGIAGPFGGMFESPHGAVCARLLPLVLAENLKAIRARDLHNPALPRFTEVARLLTKDSNAKAEDGITWVEELVRDLKIPRLSAYGMTHEQIDALVDKSQKASSMKGNPLVLSRGELVRIAEQAL